MNFDLQEAIRELNRTDRAALKTAFYKLFPNTNHSRFNNGCRRGFNVFERNQLEKFFEPVNGKYVLISTDEFLELVGELETI